MMCCVAVWMSRKHRCSGLVANTDEPPPGVVREVDRLGAAHAGVRRRQADSSPLVERHLAPGEDVVPCRADLVEQERARRAERCFGLRDIDLGHGRPLESPRGEHRCLHSGEVDELVDGATGDAEADGRDRQSEHREQREDVQRAVDARTPAQPIATARPPEGTNSSAHSEVVRARAA